jgi:hypothetical protein
VSAGRSTNAAAAFGLAEERLCGSAGTRPGVAQQRSAVAQSRSALPGCSCPPLEKGARMPVIIGVDPHKASHTAAAVDEHGQLLDHHRIPATLDGYRALRGWATRWTDRCWAVDGAHGIGRALAQRLVGDGEHVLDVPAKLTTRVRVLSVGHGRKSDGDDAVSVAVAARNAGVLRQVRVEDQAVVLHLLTKRRQDLVAAGPRPSTGCTGR